jgi:hypothetical protein
MHHWAYYVGEVRLPPHKESTTNLAATFKAHRHSPDPLADLLPRNRRSAAFVPSPGGGAIGNFHLDAGVSIVLIYY